MLSSEPTLKTAGVILAAGQASRFGSDKRLAQFDSSHTLLTRSIELFTQCCDEVFVILKPSDKENSRALLGNFNDKENISAVYSSGSKEGMGYSLSDAIIFLEALETKRSEKFAGILLGLADMPFVSVSTMKTVLASKSAKKITVPTLVCDNNNKKMGHPVWFDRFWFEELKLLRSDRGGKSIIKQNSQSVLEVLVEDAGILRDIDEPGDLK